MGFFSTSHVEWFIWQTLHITLYCVPFIRVREVCVYICFCSFAMGEKVERPAINSKVIHSTREKKKKSYKKLLLSFGKETLHSTMIYILYLAISFQILFSQTFSDVKRKSPHQINYHRDLTAHLTINGTFQHCK